jgi:hypothetical protein
MTTYVLDAADDDLFMQTLIHQSQLAEREAVCTLTPRSHTDKAHDH